MRVVAKAEVVNILGSHTRFAYRPLTIFLMGMTGLCMGAMGVVGCEERPIRSCLHRILTYHTCDPPRLLNNPFW
jgi:hypothetical protein